MNEEGSARSGPYASPRAHLAYIAKEYQAVQAFADDDPDALAYLAKLGRILDEAEARDKARSDAFASLNDDGSTRYKLALARHVLEELSFNGYVSKRVFETFALGLDALDRQEELARKTGSNERPCP
jgi:hypothetical protein